MEYMSNKKLFNSNSLFFSFSYDILFSPVKYCFIIRRQNSFAFLYNAESKTKLTSIEITYSL